MGRMPAPWKPIAAITRIGFRSTFLLVLLASCGGSRGASSAPSTSPVPSPSPSPAVVVRFEGAPPIRVEVARTPAERQRGLMHRTAVPDGTGMIFLFPQPTRVGFWMKNTLVPLSIAYVRDGRVVSTAEMSPCEAGDDCPSYPPAGPYDTAVEAPGGFFPRHGVAPGTRMVIDGLS